MADFINRKMYLEKIINRMHNGAVKIITGSRRCGKSWILKKVFRSYLVSQGVNEKNIISISLDIDEPDCDEDLLQKENLKKYIYSKITSDNEQYYIFLDEIQEVEGFERLVNGLAAKENIDVYITGSNSKFLSSDIRTIFRGRGDEIRIFPFSFNEFCTGRSEDIRELWKEYYTYGGMPGLLKQKTPAMKASYLKSLWNKTYVDDVVERNGIRNKTALEAMVDTMCSSIGSLVNPAKLANTMNSVQHIKIDDQTVSSYISCLEDSFLFEGSKRYNIKGKKYFESIQKYYAVDVGLRNARLNFRQQEITHIMENIIYNELRSRDFLVDVGLVEVRELKNGKQEYTQYEVDFIATNGMEKFYIQSAYSLADEQKKKQELKSLMRINDSFKKIVILGNDIASYTDDNGITFMGILQFLQGSL
ncbi:MAG: ATP-binding protein [Treponema porcinum]|uniref:ATP-binding protein n=1 Tax=Treponema porcinum TaxID=261392 RepID=UPI0023550E9F|nr:ATP-binding protein [Treponema porcinum]MCI6179098.1 ATP-binding protein [Treponema porcinum]MCI7080474.1 ATP-binding protein [Treponema porcinum]MDY5049454.1 ATP-binding protein [Treponema porcinum]MDY5634531.1 ATP-binding protein [Treponema porcinum]